MKKRFIAILLVLSLSLIFVGCGGSDHTTENLSKTEDVETTNEQKVLKVVCTSHQEPIVAEAQKYFQKHGYTFDIRIVELNKMIPESISDGSADLGMGVHLTFMQLYNEENKGSAHMCKPYPWYGGVGLFSNKHKNLKDIPDGGQIAVMTDVMNQDRGLRMLQEAGIIKLGNNEEPEKTQYSLMDIVDNPHNYKFTEMDQTQTVRALQDVDASVCFYSHYIASGGNVDNALLVDPFGEKYPSGFVINESMKGTELEEIAAASLRTEEMKAFVQKLFPGNYTFLY